MFSGDENGKKMVQELMYIRYWWNMGDLLEKQLSL
jgi:hypothetical protein